MVSINTHRRGVAAAGLTLALSAAGADALLFSVQAASPAPEFQGFVDKAAHGDPVVVAYLGGSITCGAGTWPLSGTDASGAAYDYSAYNSETGSWRALTFEWLRSRYETAPGQFKQINAAIGGTPSLLGAYRLEQDVLSQNPDLVFVEFAVNDSGMANLTLNNPEADRSIRRTICSIVGRLRTRNPQVAVFMPLSTHRVLEGSAFGTWDTALNEGLNQTLSAAEMLQVPFVSLRDAFYADPDNPDAGKYYGGPDTAGNYVHPAPLGHQAYASAVEAALSDLFQTGTFLFKRSVESVPPYPVNPQLVLPDALASNAPGWQIEMPAAVEAPVLEGHPCLVSGTFAGALEYTFNGTAVGLWCDTQSYGGMDVTLDGISLGRYVNAVDGVTGRFSGRFADLAGPLEGSVPHTLRLVPVSETQSGSVDATDDAFVSGWDQNKTNNYGTAGGMHLRYENGTWGCNYALVKFDLSAIPANAAIGSAQMLFRVDLLNWPATPTNFAPVSLYANNADWSETTVTYVNAPGHDPTVVQTLDHFNDGTCFTGTHAIPAGTVGWLEYDAAGVASLVRSWVDGSVPNCGISISCSGDYVPGTGVFNLAASENPAASYRPTLVVDYLQPNAGNTRIMIRALTVDAN